MKSILRAIAVLCAAPIAFCCTAAARADDPAGLLAKHKAFVGWQFADGTVQTLRYTETRRNDKGVLKETTHTTRLGALYRSSSADDKGVTSEEGFTGRVFWSSNSNGFTRPTLGDAQKAQIAAEVLFNESTPLLTGTMQASRSIDGHDYAVVRVTTPGDPLDLYVDAQTGAYKRAVIDPGGSYETTLDILDYADIAPGKKHISKWKYRDGSDVYELSEFSLNAPVDPADLHPPKQTAIWNFANAQPFKIKVTDTRVIVDAAINGVPGKFILDTGAYAIVTSQKFADKAHLKRIDSASVSGIAGTAKSTIYRADSFEIGGNKLSNVVMASVDEELDREAPDGVIGFDLFGGAIVKLDTDAQQMTLLDPAQNPVDKNGGGGVPVTVDLSTGTPQFPMKVNGNIDINATLDSGNFFYVLFGPDLRSRYGLRMLVDNSLIGYFSSHVGIGGVGGYDLGGCGHLDSVTLGPIVYQGAPACETHSFGGRDALVGFDFFKNFNYVFDYPEATIVFFPHKS